MNELQVKTNKFEPAVVEFNYDELVSTLEENLKKYDGLTFTDKDAASCKKTIADLRKGKKAVDTYRKETKKKLTESVTVFENQCKDLNVRFDEVLSPLVEQHDYFENSRKEAKRILIQNIINDLLEKEGLNEKYESELEDIPTDYLNKGKALKSIKEELTVKAESLGIKQDNDDKDQELVKSHVAAMNHKYGVNLIASSHINLLEFKGLDEVRDQAEADAEEETKKARNELPIVEPVKVNTFNQKDGEEFVETYKVIATESQLDALEEFMDREEIKWNSLA